jgi:hypothetical protein
MATTINASSASGLVTTADTSGVLQLQTAGTTAVSISSGQVATFAQAPVLPAASIPQAALAAGVAGNGPTFSAYQSTSQTLPTTAFTKIQFQGEEWDTASCFNNTGSTVGGIPAYAFLPNVAGYYQVSGRMQLTNLIGQVALTIYKNGSAYKDLMNTLGTGSVFMTLGTATVYLNGSTDYIELWGYASTSTPTQTGSVQTYFLASMVRSA